MNRREFLIGGALSAFLPRVGLAHFGRLAIVTGLAHEAEIFAGLYGDVGHERFQVLILRT
jgi:hypothetical protein